MVRFLRKGWWKTRKSEKVRRKRSCSPSHLLTFSPSVHPPPTKWTTSIRSASFTTTFGQSFFRTTSRFSSTATRCCGNDKSSISRSKLTSLSSSLISPFRVIFIRSDSLKSDESCLSVYYRPSQLDLFTLANRSSKQSRTTGIKARQMYVHLCKTVIVGTRVEDQRPEART